MGLLHHLKTQLERQIPVQLQTALQQALWMITNLSAISGRLAMHRHHRYARAIATSYAKCACKYRGSAAASVAVWPAA